MRFFFLAIIVLFALSACTSPASILTSKARSVLKTPAGSTIDQKGSVEVPAHTETKAAAVSFTIPKDSVFQFDPELQRISLRFSRDVPAIANSSEEHATAAKPSLPPSVADVVRATTLGKFYWIALALGLLAGFFFYEAHIKAGLVAAAGAIAVPLLAKFFSSDLAQYATLGVVCISGALFLAWHFVKERFTSTVTAVVSQTETAIKTVEK